MTSRSRSRLITGIAAAAVVLVVTAVVVRIVGGGDDGGGREPDAVVEVDRAGTSRSTTAVAWSADGERLYAADDGGVDVFAGTPLALVDRIDVDPERYPVSASWAPAVDRVALSGLHGGVDVFDLTTGELLVTLDPAVTGDRPAHVAWSPDGTRIAHADRDLRVVVRDATSGEEVVAFDPGDEATSVLGLAWPTPERIVAATFRSVLGIDAATGDEAWSRAFSTNGVVTASPDGERVVVGASLDDDHLVLRTDSGQTAGEVETSSAVLEAIEWSPDGARLIATGDDDRPRLWDGGEAETPEELEGWAPYGSGGAWSPDADLVAVADVFDERVVIISASGAVDPEELAAPTQEMIADVAWSPSGDRLVAVSTDGTVLEWSVMSGAFRVE